MCLTIHPKTLAEILRKISNLLVEVSTLELNNNNIDDRADKIVSKLAILIPIAHRQLSMILPEDEMLHSIFPKPFVPEIKYNEEETISKMCKEVL